MRSEAILTTSWCRAWHVTASHRKDSWDIDYRATKNVLDVARERDAKHFVLLSAICVQKPTLTFQQAKLKFEAELQEADDIWYLSCARRRSSSRLRVRLRLCKRVDRTLCSVTDNWRPASRFLRAIWPSIWLTPFAGRSC